MKPIKDMNTFEYLNHEKTLPRVDCESGVEAVEALARESKTVFLASDLERRKAVSLARGLDMLSEAVWPSQTEAYERDRESNAVGVPFVEAAEVPEEVWEELASQLGEDGYDDIN